MEISSPSNLINVLLILSGFCLAFSSTNDTILSSKFIKDPEFISSNDSRFKLGFFRPGNATNRYVGIWYLSESNVIWVANRNQPLMDSSGIVTVSEDGNLVILNGQNHAIWSSNVSKSKTAVNSSARLLDSGNLVLLHETTGETIWESFKHPCDTLVPNMRISTNKVTGEKVKLVSWKSLSDPSLGMLSFSLERLNAPETFLWNGTRPYWRSGPWNRSIFIGSPQMARGWYLGEEEDGTVYLTYVSPKKSAFSTLALHPMGKFKITLWDNGEELWMGMSEGNDCDIYGKCGAFGSCNGQNSPICSCLVGFEPRNLEEWNRQNWTSGCVRKSPLKCERMKNLGEGSEADGFLRLEMMKVPDFAEKEGGTEDICRSQCLDNCSCVAYAYDAGIGCMYWSDNLVDIRKFPSGGVDLYIRVAISELRNKINKKRDERLIIAITVTIGTLILAACAYLSWKLIDKYLGESHSQGQSESLIGDQKQIKLDELPLFDFKRVAIATDNFHIANKLGQGGFGPVYKGEFQNGQEIAVKRLSRISGQGQEEFMNEVLVISKLQHRNLVRLLGCCIQGDEMMLIYEFMPNRSLDAFLFDTLQKKSLDWRKRFIIIEGIARGLLYLHRDSRLRIIHRDLKASNILLDAHMNPKISDFGLAKIFEGQVDEANTKRIVGTYGYMSPEYAMEGLFSEKSDIYSFGVLLLEIVSGRRNTGFSNDVDQSLSLLGFAWKMWNEGEIMPLIDPEIRYLDLTEQILRCIHIGLLCVEEVASERPTMAIIVSMLNSEIVNLPPPRQPAFVQKQSLMSLESLHEGHRLYSNANLTVTNPQGR